MGQSKEEYVESYRRLVPYLPDRSRVVTRSGLGNLVSIDLDQDSGYGVGVRVDYIDGRGNNVIAKYSANEVRPLAEYKDVFLQIYAGTTWDGNLIGKSHRDVLKHLGLVTRYEGFNMITAEGIKELLRNNWIAKDGLILS